MLTLKTLKNIEAVHRGDVALEDLVAGQLIRQYRKSAKLTLKQLSEKVNFTVSHLGAVETIGKSIVKTIPRQTLKQIVDGLGLDYDAFREETFTIEKKIRNEMEREQTQKKTLLCLA